MTHLRNHKKLSLLKLSLIFTWNKLDIDIHNIPSYLIFNKNALNFIKPL